MLEKTLLIIKPDGVKRKLIGEIIKRVENKNLNIIEMKMERVTLAKAEAHYEVHKEKPFYKGLIEFITSGPVVLMVVEGENAIEIIRHLAGETSPTKALPGTIRGDFSLDILENVVHTSDSKENADKEIKNFFK
ncbi:nucleoside diphosphate kinase [Cetobacterium ceti]|uniref:Nucleoside diphosphate kinase n=1 Tax=Cetobacterium ceti TaxID=180163 RepID=A0A1T4N9H0_9FUSO|nr:nucleoside-diphosphate kinase [Cetobacterium ceti]SJZ75879.1 nucleoside diphosphate kinase [Cetobacterium ceti]